MEIKNDEVNLKNDSGSQIQIHISNVKCPLGKRTLFGHCLYFSSTWLYSDVFLLLEVGYLYAFCWRGKVICKVIYHFELEKRRSCWEKMCTSCIALFPKLCDKNETFRLLFCNVFVPLIISLGWMKPFVCSFPSLSQNIPLPLGM